MSKVQLYQMSVTVFTFSTNLSIYLSKAQTVFLSSYVCKAQIFHVWNVLVFYVSKGQNLACVENSDFIIRKVRFFICHILRFFMLRKFRFFMCRKVRFFMCQNLKFQNLKSSSFVCRKLRSRECKFSKILNSGIPK